MLQHSNNFTNITFEQDESSKFSRYRGSEQLKQIFVYGSQISGIPTNTFKIVLVIDETLDEKELSYEYDEVRDLLTINCKVDKYYIAIHRISMISIITQV